MKKDEIQEEELKVRKDKRKILKERTKKKARELKIRSFKTILRNEIYNEMMKPYFKAGNSHKNFIQDWLEEDISNHN